MKAIIYTEEIPATKSFHFFLWNTALTQNKSSEFCPALKIRNPGKDIRFFTPSCKSDCNTSTAVTYPIYKESLGEFDNF